ncbi:MAG: hypothetical protein GX621_13470 [Pirellulaceae bacterium]|nr:hypothetical protein [Pirellulaceae bacterium]
MLRNLRELAEDILGTDEPATLAMIESGHVPAPVLIGNRIARWPTVALDKWAAGGCPKSDPPSASDFMDLRVLIATEEAERELAAGLVRSPERIARDEIARRELEAAEAAEDRRIEAQMSEDFADFDPAG